MTHEIAFRRVLRKFGVDLMRAKPNLATLIQHYGVDTVLDVGANTGQYGVYLRAWGYAGRIVSFEPLSREFQELKAKADRDPLWDARNEGMGDTDGEAAINVSEYSVYSSLLPVRPEMRALDGRAGVVRTERIRVRRLDSVFGEVRGTGRSIYLKVDTQGFEPAVIRGAEGVLDQVMAVQLELSLHPLYEGELLLPEMIQEMQARGFSLVFATPVNYDDNDLSVNQLDCVFRNQAFAGVRGVSAG